MTGFWCKIKKTYREIAYALTYFGRKAGYAFGELFETAGVNINQALNWVGDHVGAKAFFYWLGGIIKGISSLLGTITNGILGIAGGITAGLVKIIIALYARNAHLIIRGFWDILSPVVGTIIVVSGKFLALVQSIFFLQGFERPLDEHETAVLNRVFKGSLNYYVTRIIEGHVGIFGLNSRSFTLGNTVYLKAKKFDAFLLVHEAIHAWQYQQTGNRYASDALGAQWFFKDAYDWQREINVLHKTHWFDFNLEAQAEFMADLWKYGEPGVDSGLPVYARNGVFFNADSESHPGHFEISGTDYTRIANEALRVVRKESC
jgi:hypothetical protein